MKDYKKFNLSQDDIFKEAVHRCLTEMYAKAQPSADFDELVKTSGVNKENYPIELFYDRYYLSQEEFEYILNKYIKAYNFTNKWKQYLDIIIDDFQKDRAVDKYFPETTDEHGTHPGYRGYETVKATSKLLGYNGAKVVLDFLKERKDFYQFDRLENGFTVVVSLGCSPTSNSDTVKEYWKSQGINIKINPRHYSEDHFWEEENG